ncbi:MAG: plasma-membrane proton-efflux P-type ATPase [Pseudomonadota bacterium]
MNNAKGLSYSQAQTLINQHGYNEIKEKKVNPIFKFLGFFWGPIPWMIEAAAILSAIIHHWEDFFIIAVLLLLNAVVGFWQEYKADNAIELLKQKLALKAKVLRDGKWLEVAARELVPGDVVRVRLGDIIPADIKLLEGDYLEVDESALTGESLPVEKKISDTAYSGSIIKKGEMTAEVTATGMNTFFGKTAKLVSEAKNVSHFQKAVIKIGDYLIVLAIALVTLIFLVALFRHESLIVTLQFALVLTVAAIPVALPAVLSVTMAVGAIALSKKEAIVSKLLAIEEMAGVDILCSDKTGTITKNELTLAEVVPDANFQAAEVLIFAALASRPEDKDPIDNAILEKITNQSDLEKYQSLAFHPFDPVSKRSEAEVQTAEGEKIKVTKGAPQMVLSLIANNEELAEKINQQVNNFAHKGYRSIGVAKTQVDGNWQWVGLIPLYDPPREDSAQTIVFANQMGVEVKMVTGDHVAIAKEIAAQVNLKTNILEASEIVNKSDTDAIHVIEQADGFAQVFPEHKYKIVELLQRAGHFVGMTGDGVNDAPALKKADAGIAVAGATDAAKSAADIVLTRFGLSVIIDAIKESRKIFQRMNSYAIYRIAETLRVLLFITLSILVFNFYPVTAIMIVLLALFNDAPIMSIAYDRVHYSADPEKWNMRIVLGIGTFLGVLGVAVTFSLFYIGDQVLHLSKPVLQTFIFLKLAVAGHLTIFMTRTRGPFWSIKPGAALFWSAVITKLLATLVAVYGFYITPIGWKLALFVWGYALAELIVTDALKVWMYKVLDHEGIIMKKSAKAGMNQSLNFVAGD